MSNDDEGSPMSASELARHFDQPVPAEKPSEKHDIYAISARVKNLASGGSRTLLPMGVMLCNSYTHVLKALYDFAETLPEPHKTSLLNLIQKHEGMPANIIAAAGAGVKPQ